MRRYYLHLRDFEGGIVEDEEGSSLASLREARDEALKAAKELLGKTIKHGEDAAFEAVLVVDEEGKQLAAVPVIAALPEAIVHTLKDPEKAVSPDRSEEYRRYADGCREMAGSASDPDDKMSWLKLADAWLQMLPKHAVPSAETSGWPKASDEDSKASH
jgi:hypothetical protein